LDDPVRNGATLYNAGADQTSASATGVLTEPTPKRQRIQSNSGATRRLCCIAQTFDRTKSLKILCSYEYFVTWVSDPAIENAALHTGGGRAKFREETPVTRQEERTLVLPVIIPALIGWRY